MDRFGPRFNNARRQGLKQQPQQQHHHHYQHHHQPRQLRHLGQFHQRQPAASLQSRARPAPSPAAPRPRVEPASLASLEALSRECVSIRRAMAARGETVTLAKVELELLSSKDASSFAALGVATPTALPSLSALQHQVCAGMRHATDAEGLARLNQH